MNSPADDPPVQGEREVPGDANAADIVGPTGEEMPVQTHDEVDSPQPPPERPQRDSDDDAPMRPDSSR